MSTRVLFFELRGTRCALPVELVREVMLAPAVTPVPAAPPPLRGVVPVHGQVLPVIDLGAALALVPGAGLAAGAGLAPAEGGAPGRSTGDQLVVIEATLPRPPADEDDDDEHADAPVRAALIATRVLRLGTLDNRHVWPPPPGASFVRATVLDRDGPALLLDPVRALAEVRERLRGEVGARPARPMDDPRAGRPRTRLVHA